MKRIDTAKTVNLVAVFLLLGFSAAYHLSQGLKAKGEDPIFQTGINFSKSSFQKTVLPTSAESFFILSK